MLRTYLSLNMELPCTGLVFDSWEALFRVLTICSVCSVYIIMPYIHNWVMKFGTYNWYLKYHLQICLDISLLTAKC